MFVLGPVGQGIPPQHGLGLKAQVLSNFIVKAPRIAGEERELYVRVIGLSALSFECSVSLSMVRGPWDCINRVRLYVVK